jgi:hypothetical protein
MNRFINLDIIGPVNTLTVGLMTLFFMLGLTLVLNYIQPPVASS